MPGISTQRGYSLVELVVVIIILGIIATVALSSLKHGNTAARTEETRMEMERLACAIAGNPELISGGTRIDYGYVGDIGAFPPNLTALYQNPGGYSTWDGPYIDDKFNDGTGYRHFTFDAWGANYTLSGVEISSTGGPSTFTLRVANSLNDLTSNTVSMVITDFDRTPPGTDYQDSVEVLLTYPNGSGSTTTATRNPGGDGFVSFNSIPIGQHTLRVVYIPDNDTIERKVNVNPGNTVYSDIQLYGNLW